MIPPAIQKLLSTQRIATASGLFGIVPDAASGQDAQRVAGKGDTSDLTRFFTPGFIHEWFGFPEADHGELGPRRQIRWHPPLGILLVLIQDIFRVSPTSTTLLWIGRRCWPMPSALGSLVADSFLIDPPDDAARIWMIDQALRCPGVVVVADGSGIAMAQSRRLQLGAEAGRALGFLARPPWEIKELSAAATRWMVHPARSQSHQPRWSVELVRRKAAAITQDSARRWIVERVREGAHAPDSLRVLADVVNGPGRAQTPRAAQCIG